MARAYLEYLGWRIIQMNYRCQAGEMDIIAEETTPTGVILVFIEVKSRRSLKHGSPIEAVSRRKQDRLAAIALTYLGERNISLEEPACRFDVAEVFISPDTLGKVVLHRGLFGAS